MDDAIFPHSITSGAFADINADFDLVEDLLVGGCWLETADCSDLIQHGAPPAANVLSSSYLLPSFDVNNSSWSPDMPQTVDQYGGGGSVILDRPVFVATQTDQNIFQSQPWGGSTSGATTRGSSHLESFTDEGHRTLEESEMNYPGSEPGRRLWIQPSSDVGLTSSVKERLMQALNYIWQSKRDGDVLVQIWVPVKSGGRDVLTTFNQPFSLSSGSQALANYRNISMKYEFPTEDSNQAVGLPGRVFIGKLPEWTPDVRYFKIEEYPRINDAQQCDVRGTLALPIFEQGSQACLGVVEVVMTKQKTSYRPELESICKALQAFNLTSCEGLTIPHLKASNGSFQVALPEISKVLKVVCDTHRLPLAQTWVPCMQQNKKGSRHSGENYANCISTVDTACIVNDVSIQGFHEACSDHHLLRGQGVSGQAFTTNQPCFSANITDFRREEYPLSHYAKMFKLRAAVAIRLRSIYAGNVDYVLEFFLPVDCINSEEQKEMLISLSAIIQKTCQTLRVVTDRELENEIRGSVNEEVASGRMLSKCLTNEDTKLRGDYMCTSKEPLVEKSSQTTSLMWSELKGKRAMHPTSLPSEFQVQEYHGFATAWDPVVPAGKIFSDLDQHHQDSSNANLDHGDSSLGEYSILDTEKAAEKKRTRAEKTISLEVLRQYFAGSLKDAAKSLGVCPTTLKRICRQHGITRWPSRKIKKVGHSLRKLQVVIDSVQGAEGVIPFSSLYANFPQPSPNAVGDSTFSTLQKGNPQKSSITAQPEVILSTCTAPVKSPSSSCSQSSSSSLNSSSGAQQLTPVPNLILGQDASVTESHIVTLKKAYSEVQLHQLAGEETGPPSRSHSQKSLSNFLSLEKLSSLPRRRNAPRVRNFLRLKVIYGEEKLKFKMLASVGYLDLQKEVARRLNIDDMSSICLKYLDDDADWVLLTCDDDLQECKDIYSSSLAHSIKLSVHHVAQTTTKRSFGSSGLL